MSSTVVFDVNALLSAAILPDSVSAQALRWAREHVRIAVSDPLLEQTAETFARRKFDRYVTQAVRADFLASLRTTTVRYELTESITLCRDPDDDLILSTALSAAADYLVTGDLDLLVLHPWGNVQILRPGDFLRAVSA